MHKILKLGAVRFIITAVTGLILGAVHTVTLEPIREAQAREKNDALKATMPGAQEFKEVKLTGDAGIIKEIYEGTANGKTVGYDFTVTPKGYGGPLKIIVGVGNDGRVKDLRILTSSETPGLGAKAAQEPFAGQFREKVAKVLTVTKTPPTADTEIQAISGATITSLAVTRGVNTAIEYWQKNFSEDKAAATTAPEAKEAPAAPEKPDAVSSASEKEED